MIYRNATIHDQLQMLEIYNHAVMNTVATFDTEPRTFEKQIEWFQKHKKNHPVFVAEENGKVIGWSSLSPWSDRCAYDTTVEVSVYVHPDFHGKKTGSKLLELVTLEGKKVNNHCVLSRITEGNQISVHIHEKLGYVHIGTMKEVGFKFGKFLDVVMMELLYD